MSTIFDHANLAAWEVIPYDHPGRTARERAELFRRLGFGRYAYLSEIGRWVEPSLTRAEVRRDAETEIAAMQEAGIDLSAWYFWLDDEDRLEDDVEFRPTLEAIAAAGLSPQIWVAQAHRRGPRPDRWVSYLPPGVSPTSDTDDLHVRNAIARAAVEDLPTDAAAYDARVAREAYRIASVRAIAAQYGCRVHIYNHCDWFGRVENELEILAALGRAGIDDVGLVYNFSHAWDGFHDDRPYFAELWNRMREHVVAVNVTGMEWDGEPVVYPSEGHGELEMLRTIAASGWEGPLGLLQQRFGDAEEILANDVRGLDWLAGEIAEPGSAGPRPALTTAPRPEWAVW
jgi:sugar phosphate isomerase/epimerase